MQIIFDTISVQPAQPARPLSDQLQPTARQFSASTCHRMQTAWSSAWHSDRSFIKCQGGQGEIIVNLLINYAFLIYINKFDLLIKAYLKYKWWSWYKSVILLIFDWLSNTPFIPILADASVGMSVVCIFDSQSKFIK